MQQLIELLLPLLVFLQPLLGVQCQFGLNEEIKDAFVGVADGVGVEAKCLLWACLGLLQQCLCTIIAFVLLELEMLLQKKILFLAEWSGQIRCLESWHLQDLLQQVGPLDCLIVIRVWYGPIEWVEELEASDEGVIEGFNALDFCVHPIAVLVSGILVIFKLYLDILVAPGVAYFCVRVILELAAQRASDEVDVRLVVAGEAPCDQGLDRRHELGAVAADHAFDGRQLLPGLGPTRFLDLGK